MNLAALLRAWIFIKVLHPFRNGTDLVLIIEAGRNISVPAWREHNDQTERIEIVCWVILHISVQIEITTREFYWIFADKPLQHWGIIPCTIVVSIGAIVFPACKLEGTSIGCTRNGRCSK
jgi:hypothetical protein